MCYSVSRLIAREDEFILTFPRAFTHSFICFENSSSAYPLSKQHVNTRMPCSYYTAYAYLLTVFLCFAYRRNYFQILASQFSIRLLRRRNDYCDIPDAKQFDAAASGGLPLFHQSGRRRRHRFGAASAMWNRCFILLRNVWQRWCCGMRFSLTGRDNTKRRRE